MSGCGASSRARYLTKALDRLQRPSSPEIFMSRIACLTVFLLTLGCRSTIDTTHETQVLLDTDRAWAQISSTSRNTDSVVTFWSDDARVAPPNGPLLRGKAALREMVASSYAAPGFHITWTPENAVVAASGDLGYTTGTNEVSMQDSTGKVTKMVGRYITVWRRGSDGRWRCVEEYSSPAPLDARSRA